MFFYLVYTAIAIAAIFIIVSSVMRKRIYKEVDRLEEWKNGILNRDIPDEIGKVKKLHMSGQTEEKFETWRNEWDEIVGVILPDIEEKLFDIEDLAAKNRFAKAKQLLDLSDKRLTSIEVQIKNLLEDVEGLVQSEEQNRSEIDEVRAAYKELYTVITKKRGSLGPGLVSFDEQVDKVNELLELFDESTAEGSYLKAREHLVEAHSLVTHLEQLIEEYPKLLVQVETKIPAEMMEILDGMKEMEAGGYQLEPFAIPSRLEVMEQELAKIKEELVVLKCDGVEEQLLELSTKIENLYDTLEYEVESKQYVDTQLEQLSLQVQESKQKVEALANETLDVQKSYFVSKQQISTQKQIKDNVHDLTNQLYVLFDLAEHQKQTYTSIREMVDKWQEEMKTIVTQIDEEKETLFALREDERAAKETLQSLRHIMLETNRVVKKSNIPGLPQRAVDQLESAEESLIRATNQLSQVPLELGRVTVLVEEAEATVKKNQEMVMGMVEQADLAEKVIQYGNRYRSRSQDVTIGLLEAESYFRQFEYEEALECARSVIEKYEPNVVDIVKGYMPV
ncbi:septation ring formation regulator EzrA [Alkalihalobacillus sp. MEB130]|uniref:septation ring formation regulator EzrA n=1 Tax=Alkalihalobacillus sp. MEB130 TaxID=2976704 RepID=UPI0028DD7BCD|nr:septation ring formation regulator EzrA [Alkalihalobacillus sp. MEB130]MDT8859379.1 septation ring formation regulator EzrA [Alkalihalobacillus sp. MEB130]